METELEPQFFNQEFTADDIIPGQLLAIKKPPEMGKGGLTIAGSEIPPSLGEDISFIPGKNTFLSEDGLRLYASGFGRLTWKENQAEVELTKEIDGNLNQSLIYNGCLKVNGSIGEGAKISTTGDVIIQDGVENAEIKCEGSIMVGKGIVKGKLFAEKDIKALSAKESTLQAKGYVIMEEGGLSQCTVEGYGVICKEKKGGIVGGTIKAKKVIQAALIGSERASVQTEIKIDQGGILAVQGSLYPKVKMAMGRRVMIAKKLVKRFTMKVEGAGVSTTTYEEPRIESREVIQFESKGIDLQKYPLSVVVSAQSIDEGRKKGAQLLGLSPGEVSCKPLKKEGSRAVWLRVFPKDALGPWDYEKWEELYGPPVDGSFSFDNRTDGVFVTIIHHRGKGKRVTPTDIISACQREGFENIDAQPIEEACAKRITDAVKIGPRQFFKGTVVVTLPPDESEASIKIIPPKWGGMLIKMDDITHALAEKKVSCGVKKERISEALQNAEFNLDIKIAEQLLPDPGPGAYLRYQCGLKDGQELIHSQALPGQLLAIKTPPAYGKPGKTVLGKDIQPVLGPDLSIIPGKNTFISKDKLKAFSCARGRITWSDNRVDVEPVLELDKPPKENIDFPGIVHITGDLRAKIKVAAYGDVMIKGNVEEAEIDSGGSVIIEGEILMAKIGSAVSIKATAAKNATLNAKGDIILSEGGLINCTVSGQRVICPGNKGLIMGGNIIAKREINTKIIGSDRSSIQTTVKVDQGGKIAAGVKVFPKVNLILGRKTITTKKLLKSITLKSEGGGVATVGYENPVIEEKAILELNPDITGQKPTDFATPLSVIVTASSPDEAKRKAVELIDLPFEKAEAMSIPKRVPTFRVYQAGVLGPWQEDDWNMLYGAPQDASFELINQIDGLFLEVTPHQANGKPLEAKDIFDRIEKEGYSGFDSAKIIEICKANKKGKYRVGVMQFTKEIGGIFQIEVDENASKATLTIIPPSQGEVLIQLEHILSALKEKGITTGINQAAILNTLKNKEFGQAVVVAEAIPPQPGKKASLTFQFGKQERGEKI